MPRNRPQRRRALRATTELFNETALRIVNVEVFSWQVPPELKFKNKRPEISANILFSIIITRR